jgi:hypothetical protein
MPADMDLVFFSLMTQRYSRMLQHITMLKLLCEEHFQFEDDENTQGWREVRGREERLGRVLPRPGRQQDESGDWADFR